ncbi:hypothetical protein [Escherichia coli]
MAHDVPLGCAPDEYDDLISGTCSHLPKSGRQNQSKAAAKKGKNSGEARQTSERNFGYFPATLISLEKYKE